MIEEIINLYKTQLQYYEQIHNILYDLKKDDFDIERHNIEMENINYILEKINSISVKAEQLKQIYILKNNLNDFIGSEIQKIESQEKYNELKSVVEGLTDRIAAVKKLQDDIIYKINKKENDTIAFFKEVGKSKNAVETYKKMKKS